MKKLNVRILGGELRLVKVRGEFEVFGEKFFVSRWQELYVPNHTKTGFSAIKDEHYRGSATAEGAERWARKFLKKRGEDELKRVVEIALKKWGVANEEVK